MTDQLTRHCLVSVMAVIFMLTACAGPPPGASQDPPLVERVIEQSVALTVAAQTAQAQERKLGELSDALTAAAQNASAATAEPVETLPDVTEAAAPTSEPASTGTEDPNAPTVQGISPNTGSVKGGDIVTITGTNFAIGKGHTRFYFGSQEATNVECISTMQCTVTIPAGTEGNVTVRAELTRDRPSDNTSSDIFNYIPVNENEPVITRITPREGPMRGGTTVIIEGRNFLGGEEGAEPDATKFYFGENLATEVVCETPIECKVKSPAGLAGIVIVKAENFVDGQSVESQHIEGNDYDGFKYNGPAKYGCSALTVTPRKGTVLDPEEHFTIHWIITNTGENAWPAGIDIKYSAGVQLSTSTRVEVPMVLKPNESWGFEISAVAPDKPGTYYMSWTVEGMGCAVYVAIDVE